MTKIKFVIGFVALLAFSACGDSDSDSDIFSGKNGSGFGGQPNPVTVEYFNEVIGDTILFNVDQSTLTPEAIEVLNQQARWLLENPTRTVLIEGHADEQGTREYNLALGARRAAAVSNYLVGRGLTDERVRTLTFGKERPLAICSDEVCWAKNRRAVTLVDGGQLGR